MADQPTKEMKARLFRAAIYEGLCFGAGVIGFFATSKLIWIFIGVLAGLGFSVPAIIRFVREAKERDRASR